PVQLLQRVAVDIFMSSMQRICSGNKSSDRLKLLLLIKELPRIFRFHPQFFKRSPMKAAEQFNRTCQGSISHAAINGIYSRMVAVRRSEQVGCTKFPVIMENILQLEQSNRFRRMINQCYFIANG